MIPPHAMTASRPPVSALAPVLICAALIVCVAMGMRYTFGLFLAPMSADHGWSRELFSFVLGVVAALLNLAIDKTALASRRGQPAVA